MKQITSLIFLFLSINFLYAQQELSLHFLQNIGQSNLTNPALVTSHKTDILLPSFYYNLYTPDFTLKKLFALNARGVRNLNEIAENTLDTRNRIRTDMNGITFGIAYKAKPKLRLSLTHAYNAAIHADIDGVLIKAIMNHYNENKGKPIPFNTTINGYLYHQLAVGAAYQYRDNISLGARIKLLKGIAGMFTHSGQSIVTIEGANYATGYNNNIDVVSYSLDKLKQLKTLKGLSHQSFNTDNLGIGLDIGLTYKHEKVQFSASVVDVLSYINWGQNGKNYTSQGVHHFLGVNTTFSLFKGDKSATFSLQDTLKSILGLKIAENPKYVQKLPTKIYLSTTYKLNDKLQLGALVYAERGGDFPNQTDFMLHTSYKIIKNIELGSSWSMRNKRFDNIGLDVITHYKGIQLYALTDNILTAFNPYNYKSSNARIGVNVVLK
jgi:hypothetical protein